MNLIAAIIIAIAIYSTTDHHKEKQCTDDGCPSWHEEQ